MSSTYVNAMDIVEMAKSFAHKKHKGQKYGGHPYTKHLEDVVCLVQKYESAGYILAAAWLHDVVEDQGVSIEEIIQRFGPAVGRAVWALTDPPLSERPERKEISLGKLRASEPGTINIKLADRISNMLACLCDLEKGPNTRAQALLQRYLRENTEFSDKLYPFSEESLLWGKLYKVTNNATSVLSQIEERSSK